MRLSTFGLLVPLALSIGLFWTPCVATAQQPGKVYRIGFLSAYSSSLPSTPYLDAFWQQLRELGWIEGQNLVMERRWAETRFERMPALATELAQLKVDVILTDDGAATVAAKQATRTIPIVMRAAIDAVAQGFVASLAHPGANVTGLTLMTSDLDPKRLELLKETVPGSTRMTVLACQVVPGAAFPARGGGKPCWPPPKRWASNCTSWRCKSPTTRRGPLLQRAASVLRRCSSLNVILTTFTSNALWTSRPSIACQRYTARGRGRRPAVSCRMDQALLTWADAALSM